MLDRSLRIACCALALACGARYERVPLVDTPDLSVTLRSEKRDGALLARGFLHPTAISATRATSILARIEVRESGRDADERRPAIPSELAPTLGAALADALGRADPTQEIALRAQRRERRLAVFTRRFTTSFVAFVDPENRLQIHLVDADRELPPGEDSALPEPIAGRGGQAIKVLPGPHVESLGERAVAVDWRADAFREPVRGDEVGRRRTTILMESADTRRTAPAPPEDGPIPDDPDVLRDLADLEAGRRAGTLSETEYQRRRAELLGAERD